MAILVPLCRPLPSSRVIPSTLPRPKVGDYTGSLQGGSEAPRGLLTAMGPTVTTHELQEGNACLMRTVLGSKVTLVDLWLDPSEQAPCPSLGCDPELLVSPVHGFDSVTLIS